MPSIPKQGHCHSYFIFFQKEKMAYLPVMPFFYIPGLHPVLIRGIVHHVFNMLADIFWLFKPPEA